jgi:hypothetical protein
MDTGSSLFQGRHDGANRTPLCRTTRQVIALRALAERQGSESWQICRYRAVSEHEHPRRCAPRFTEREVEDRALSLFSVDFCAERFPAASEASEETRGGKRYSCTRSDHRVQPSHHENNSLVNCSRAYSTTDQLSVRIKMVPPRSGVGEWAETCIRSDDPAVRRGRRGRRSRTSRSVRRSVDSPRPHGRGP